MATCIQKETSPWRTHHFCSLFSLKNRTLWAASERCPLESLCTLRELKILKGKATRVFSFPLETFSQNDPFLPVLFILPEPGQRGRPSHPHTIYRHYCGQLFYFIYFFASFHFCWKESPNSSLYWWFFSQATHLAKPRAPRPPQNTEMPGNLRQVPLIILAVQAFCFHLPLLLKQFFAHAFRVSHLVFFSLAYLPWFSPPLLGLWLLPSLLELISTSCCVYVSPQCQAHWCGEWSPGEWSWGGWVISHHLPSPWVCPKWQRLLSPQCHWETTQKGVGGLLPLDTNHFKKGHIFGRMVWRC